jgi:hypothetical protein
MGEVASVLESVALVLGLVCAGLGVVTLARGRAPIRWLTRQSGPRTYAWSNVLTAVFISTETVPRLSGADDVVVLYCTVAALAPLIALVALALSARRPPTGT